MTTGKHQHCKSCNRILVFGTICPECSEIRRIKGRIEEGQINESSAVNIIDNLKKRATERGGTFNE